MTSIVIRGVAGLACGIFAALGGGCASQQTDKATSASAETLEQPGLKVGAKAPDATLLTAEGGSVQLASMYADGPVVVTFYRGGWCPYCNRALSDWRAKMDELQAAGGTFVAVTPEKPSAVSATMAKNNVNFTVLSDATLQAAKAFKVHFVVDDETQKKYKGYGIDVGATNASGTWELPAPGTFVIDRGGVVRYAFADWDYKKRANPDEVIAAVKQLTGN